jgi:deoxyuridine 5'-triphosphate nucleotidohydrolase
MTEPRVVRIEYKLMDSYSDEDGVEHILKDEALKLPRLPTKSKREDAGYDVYSAQDGVVPGRGSCNFHTGVRVACPLGWFYSVRGRSGLGFKGVEPFIGTLDATYNGELRILLYNLSDQPYEVHKGDRIAQIILEEQIEMDPHLVDEFSPEYDKRGHAGFGSSGR